MRSASSLELLCADCYASRETPALQETCRRARGASPRRMRGVATIRDKLGHINQNHMVLK
jgi:hypothetical protein